MNTTETYRLIYQNCTGLDAIEAQLCQIQGAKEIHHGRTQSGVGYIDIVCSSGINIESRFTNTDIEVAALSLVTPKLKHKGVLLMDMDSTAIQIECIDELAKLAGIGDKVSDVTELAMLGQLDFEQSLRQRVALLEGLDAGVIQQLCDELPLTQGLESMVKELKAHGWVVAVASGGFTPFVNHLKNKLGLDGAFANELEIIDGKLTGKVIGRVVDAQAKADILTALAEQYDVEINQTIAVGDGANDIPMLKAAGGGVAFHAKPAVQQQAQVSINHLGLDSILALLG
ncbi:phosphoserine phosphatase SerB [Parashewanella curva]|uniref:Phosphoserine phosphatase n=1 Tax=Parashewanella curva TaxID=2338552 RepID=A0A3L8Q3J4_9GAMM|nr:phosphoserine phosphatase SerB [Parashewanella curva]RLV61282.1 phosphoserine phosphatase SerB [Parashewanella curva]